jgi:hypothetical protein
MDVHKATISISVAEAGRSGPVRFIGVIPNTPEAVGKMAKQLAKPEQFPSRLRSLRRFDLASSTVYVETGMCLVPEWCGLH